MWSAADNAVAATAVAAIVERLIKKIAINEFQQQPTLISWQIRSWPWRNDTDSINEKHTIELILGGIKKCVNCWKNFEFWNFTYEEYRKNS